MFLADETRAVVNILKDNDYFFDKTVIMAYPYAKKPTLLKSVFITVSPSALNAENIETGGECLFGSYTIDTDVFVPHEMGSPCVFDVIEKVIKTLLPFYPGAVRAGEITSQNELGCFTAKCSFTFSSEITFKGENDE